MATSLVPPINDVVINIKEITQTPSIGYGNLLIMTKAPASYTAPDNSIASETGGSYKEYTNLEGVGEDFDEGSATYTKAQAYFNQPAHGAYLMIVSYPDGKASDTLKDFFWYGWHFAVLDTFDQTVAAELDGMMTANAEKFLVLQVADYTTLKPITGAYTIGIQHPVNEPIDAGLVGAVANKTVGSQTWKFQTVDGITPQRYNNTAFAKIKAAHVIVYTAIDNGNVAGSTPQGETSEGFTLNGEYIDSLFGDTWIKEEMRNRIQSRFLDNAKGKVSYDKQGIDLLEQLVRDVLSEAWSNGIILTGTDGNGVYETKFKTRDQMSQSEINSRDYNGGSFNYERSGAIHSVTINGEVLSDSASK